jgi:hypothetical protein
MIAKTVAAGFVLALGLGAGASAHHSYAMFDLTRIGKAEATVAKLEWANPHVFLFAYVKNGQGGYQLYAFESDAIARLTRMGWSPAALPAGQKVTVEYSPLRDGRPGGKLQRIYFPDGKMLSTTEAPPQARP